MSRLGGAGSVVAAVLFGVLAVFGAAQLSSSRAQSGSEITVDVEELPAAVRDRFAEEVKAVREQFDRTIAEVKAARERLSETLAEVEFTRAMLSQVIAAARETMAADVKAAQEKLSTALLELETANKQLSEALEKIKERTASGDVACPVGYPPPLCERFKSLARDRVDYVPHSVDLAPPTANGSGPGHVANVTRPIDDAVIKLGPEAREVRTPSAPDRIYWAVRDLIARDYDPSEQYGAVGIVAFTSMPRPDSPRDIAICENFKGTLVLSAEAEQQGHPKERQIATLWPVLSAAPIHTAQPAWQCNQLISSYDLGEALQALDDAMRAKVIGSDRDLKRRPGPILIAWSPSKARGSAGSVALYADLSGANTEAEIAEAFRIWRSDVEQNPDLWSNGFSLEKLRQHIKRIADKYGKELLSLI